MATRVHSAAPVLSTGLYCSVLGECVLLVTIVGGVLFASSRGVGVAVDEAIYFIFSDSITRWFTEGRPLNQVLLDEFWGYSSFYNPHPPFMKIISAMSASTFSGVAIFPLNYRIGTLAYVALCITLAYGLIRCEFSRLSSLAAILFSILQPRVFGHLLLATTDGPIAVAWLVCTLLAWRITTDRGARSHALLRLALVIIYVCAAGTKFTGFLIAIPLLAHFSYRRCYRDIAYVLGSMGCALCFIVAISPEQWAHPLQAMRQYLFYPFTRAAIPMETIYFGRTYLFNLPPEYFAVMSLITYPLGLSALLIGAVFLRGRHQEILVPVTLAIAFWLILVHLPETPKHDGVRQFVSIYPLLGIVSWVGLNRLCHALAAERWRTQLRVDSLAGMFIGVVLAIGVWRSHPHELSYYNALIGGIRGAEEMGLEMTYYCTSIGPEMVSAINHHLTMGTTLYMVPYWADFLRIQQIHGAVRTDLVLLPKNTKEVADYVLACRRRGVIDDRWYRSQTAVFDTLYEGVSLAKLVRLR